MNAAANQLPSHAYANEQDRGFFQHDGLKPERPVGKLTDELKDAPLVMGDLKRSKRVNNQGHVIEVLHRRVHIMQMKRFIEAPKGSGNLWYENTNDPAGRVTFQFNDRGSITGKAIDEKAEHVLYIPPKPTEQIWRENMEQLQKENQELKANALLQNSESDAMKLAEESEIRAIDAEKKLKDAQAKIKALETKEA